MVSAISKAVTITDDGNNLKITSGSSVVWIPKKELTVSVSGDYIFIGTLRYKYTDITNISASSAEDLADTLDEYIENL